MAVKKATAKKSAAKRAVAKKAPVKPVKKTTAKRAAAKPVKKAAPKKVAAKPVKKATAKKAAVKKVAAKKVAAKPIKKAAAKKPASKPVKKSAVKKSAAKETIENIVVPELPVGSARSARPEVSPAVVVSPVVPPVVIAAPPVKAPVPVAKQGPSGRVILAVIVGIILLAAIVWSRAGNDDVEEALPEATQTAVASPTPLETMSEPTPTPEATQATETPAPSLVYEAPTYAVGNYTTTGLRLTWKAPAATDGLTGYNIEISRNGGAFEMFSNLPASQLSLDLTKSGTNGWTTFRISSVYSDDQVASVSPFGFPGQFS